MRLSVSSLAITAAIALSVMLSSSRVMAAPVTCTNWGGPMSWVGTAYAVGTARLYQVIGSTTVLIESSTDDALWTTSGYQVLGADWDSVPLEGTYFGIVEGT